MTVWTDETVESLKTMLADGLTSSAIAAALPGNISRNAVIGKILRMGLKGPRSGMYGARAHGVTKSSERQAGPDTKPRPFVCKAIDVEPLHINIMELTDATCRWPMGNDPAPDKMTYCGHFPWGSSSYCEAHTILGTGHGSRGEQYAMRLPRKVA